jgi:hypothetical protein
MSERYNIRELLSRRANQPSFHIVAEKHVRSEFRNMKAGETLGPFSFEGNVIVTCFGGTFTALEKSRRAPLREHDQVVFEVGETVDIACDIGGALQIMWLPAHAATITKR